MTVNYFSTSEGILFTWARCWCTLLSRATSSDHKLIILLLVSWTVEYKKEPGRATYVLKWGLSSDTNEGSVPYEPVCWFHWKGSATLNVTEPWIDNLIICLPLISCWCGCCEKSILLYEVWLSSHGFSIVPEVWPATLTQKILELDD